MVLCRMAASQETSIATTQPAPADWDDRIIYKKVGDIELSLSLVRPDRTKFPGPRPGIVFFHGGGWHQGQPEQFAGHCRELADHGMVAFSVEYRLRNKHQIVVRDCIADAFAAFRYVREHAADFGIDPKKLAAGGGSAGGHLAACLATLKPDDILDPDEPPAKDPAVYRPDALVLFNPVYDANPGRNENVRQMVGDNWKLFSPSFHVNAQMPPTLVMLGDQDKIIPVATAEKFRDDMKALGVRSELKIYPGQPHGFFNKACRTETIAEMIGFLKSLDYLPK